LTDETFINGSYRIAPFQGGAYDGYRAAPYAEAFAGSVASGPVNAAFLQAYRPLPLSFSAERFACPRVIKGSDAAPSREKGGIPRLFGAMVAVPVQCMAHSTDLLFGALCSS
jgi:hypothetical protein